MSTSGRRSGPGAKGECRARLLALERGVGNDNSFRALMVERDDNEEIHEIQTVTKDERWADLGIGDITVDRLTIRAGHKVKVMLL